MTSTPSSSQQARPLEIGDITVIDNSKLKKAVTAAALGNAMEWFDFGVYGFVAFALGKVFFPDASPAVQTIAALGTFSVPESPVADHHHHGDKHLLHRADPLV